MGPEFDQRRAAGAVKIKRKSEVSRASAPVQGSSNNLPTTFLLMAQYGGRTIIPLDEVCRDFFAHLTPDKLVRKVASGDVRLPVVRMEASQKSAKGVHLSDLADYLDKRREVARREMDALSGQ